MTARVLNLGLLKAFSDFKHLVQVGIIFNQEDTLAFLSSRSYFLVISRIILIARFIFRIFRDLKILYPLSNPCKHKRLLLNCSKT